MNLQNKLQLIQRVSCIMFLTLFIPNLMAQEQAHYSLYNLYQPSINPAAMGSFDRFTAAGIFNYQMIGFNGAPVNLLADVTAPIGKTNLIIGGQVQHDRIGVRNKTQLSLSFAYRILLNIRNYLSIGLTSTLKMHETSFQNAAPLDPNDPLLANQTNQVWSPDFKIGLYYFRDNFYAGASVGNIFTTNFSNSQNNLRASIEDIHFYLHTGFQVNFNKAWKFQPSFLWKQIAGSPAQFDINTQFLFQDVWGFGLSYRTLNTLVIQTNVTVAKTLQIGYAFNMGLGFSNSTQYTGHEIMIVYRSNKYKKKIPVQVPRF